MYGNGLCLSLQLQATLSPTAVLPGVVGSESLLRWEFLFHEDVGLGDGLSQGKKDKKKG